VGAAPFCFPKGAGFDSSLGLNHAQPPATPLRAGRSPLHHLLLLSSATFSGNPSRPAWVCEGAGRSSLTVRIPTSRLCGDARTCSSIDQRASQKQPFEGRSGLEAKGLPRSAPQKERASAGAVGTPVQGFHQGGIRFLAEAVLRFQRVEQQKTAGETGLHAQEPCAAKACLSSQGLAVEQLVAIYEERAKPNPDRYAWGSDKGARTEKPTPAPFGKQKGAAPKSSSWLTCGPPAGVPRGCPVQNLIHHCGETVATRRVQNKT
jgi:hypothetical protein